MKLLPARLLLLVSMFTVPAAVIAQSASAPPADAASSALRSSVETWREKRFASLTSENGWLSLVALLPLRPGKNTLGSAASNSLRLDRPDVPARAARIAVNGGKITLTASADSGITLDGKPVTRIDLRTDASGAATVLALGTLRFFVIDRVGHLFLRVRDVNNPKLSAFHGVASYPVRDEWNITARFEPYVPARKISIVNILGLDQDMPSPGALVFEKDGQSWRLDVVDEDPSEDALMVMFADGTSGRETYGAGRFLKIPRRIDGVVQLDFNKAYNPPCAFNDFATCPLPPQQNKLSLRVEAGELRYGH